MDYSKRHRELVNQKLAEHHAEWRAWMMKHLFGQSKKKI